MEFYTIPNLASTDVTPAVPWEFEPRPIATQSKAVYKGWCNQSTTEHMFYSGWVGVAPGIRVSDQNPPHAVSALVADYDAKVTDDELAGLRKRVKGYCPSFVHRTPTSGGARLIWTLDHPVMVPSPRVAEKMLLKAKKALGVDQLLPGLDAGCWKNFRIYFDVGRDWMEVPGGEAIPATEVMGWVVEASEGVKWQGDAIPMEVLSEELDRRFPGRWGGPFEEGARGVRFWDPSADNPTAAIVRPTGMQCFTGPRPFVTWAEIFGAAFVERHQAQDLGRAVENVWSDGRSYWYPSEDGTWEPRAEKDMVRLLKVAHGLSAERDDGRTHSQVERVLHVIDQTRRVTGAAPFIYRPAGMIDFMGRRVLNTARVTAVRPATEDPVEWGEGFPWLSQFLEELFDPEEQLHWVLAWLKRFYCGALEGMPRQGQTAFIHGPTGRGKTFFSNRVVSGLVGGHADASSYLLGDTNFNKELFHVGLWTIDDATPGDTNDQHRAFSTFLKKVTANTVFSYHAKFQDPVMVEWSGRVIVTGNLDPESLRILPDCDTSILDKLFFLKTSKRVRHFPDRHALEKTVRRELPHLAAFLVSHEPDPGVLSDDPRYGVECYHHPELRDAAGELTDASVLTQVLETFMKERVDHGQGDWKGTSLQLLQEFLLDETVKPLISRFSPRWMGIQLAKLESQGRSITGESRGGARRWVIRPDSFLESNS